MEAGYIILAIATCVIGVLVGVRIERHEIHKSGTQGVIYAYFNSPESDPSLLLEYHVPINDIASRKRVLFDVVALSQDSHE